MLNVEQRKWRGSDVKSFVTGLLTGVSDVKPFVKMVPAGISGVKSFVKM